VAKVVAALAAVCVALAGAACGSSSSSSGVSTAKVSATAYATSLCEALAPFDKEVASSSQALEDVGSLSAVKGKTMLVSFLAGLAGDTSAAVNQLRAAGVPEVNGGATFSQAILKTFTNLQGALGRSEKVAQQLSTTSETAFESGAHELATAVKESVGEIGKGLSTKANPALDAAAAKAAACHGI
jgi:hypothetical protein